MFQLSDKQKVAHLLRRFGLGASEAEVEYYGQGGVAAAIDRLLDWEKVDDAIELTVDDFALNGQNLNVRGLQSWWWLQLLSTRRPLLEKMTLFWHDHFATSAAKVDIARAMHRQNEILRTNATGKFQTLLTEVSKDPAMLYWLDNHFNVKGKPNENFAREIMELFTLGVDNYSERDVQEAARAFTGWSFGVGPQGRLLEKPARNARFVNRVGQHDGGTKTILGNTGDFDGDDVIGILCGNPRTAYYISEKLWNWFAYPDPDKSVVERVAAKFRSSGLDIKVALRAIMESPEFYSEKAFRKVYKNPVDFTVATMRQLGIGKPLVEQIKEAPPERKRLLQAPVAVASRAATSMGMELFFPPDVAGWDGGAMWISSATMVERIKWADKLFGTTTGRGDVRLRYPAYPLISQDSTPQGVVTKLLSLFDAPMPPEKVRQLVDVAKKEAGGNIDPTNANDVMVSVARLVFGSPEFQFC